jgi:hypothetical protein
MRASLQTRRVLVRALVAFAGIALLAPAGAWAVEAEPLKIEKFSMQTTEKTNVSGPIVKEPNGTFCEPCHIENVPYATPFTQAGGHPWAITTTGALKTETLQNGAVVPTRDPKDIVVNLPVGLLGDPLAVPGCPLTKLVHLGDTPCSGSTQIGMFRIRLFGGKEEYGPIVNVTPEAGQSAEIGLQINRVGTTNASELLTAHLVHTEQGYRFTVITKNIQQTVQLVEYELAVWGVPADPSHDRVRGMSCWETSIIGGTQLKCVGGGESAGVVPVPFWSLPTDCGAGPETVTMRADSWQEPGSVVEGRYSEQFKTATGTMPGVTGCNLLSFDPGLEVQPSSLMADEPVGLGVNIEVPQPEKPEVDATPHLRDAVVTLPQGMSINPSVVDGIQACNDTGPEGINVSGPESEEVSSLTGELQLAPGHCPAASTVGTAEAVTPLLGTPVKGHVYLARPGCGNAALGQAPCTEQDALDGNLYKLYLELGGTGVDAKDGIEIKVPGRVQANPATGQLTTRFEGSPPGYEGNPQAPFSELRVQLNPGPRAEIANPAVCGPAVATADFTPWSEPGITPEGVFMAGTPDAVLTANKPFAVTGCTTPTPFGPGFVAGTVTPNAGQFSAFTMNLSRNDREQYVKGIQVHTPPGLLGMLSSVPLCPEAQANAGTCPESSQIGTTRVATGAGSHPFEIEGDVYLTGPYGGDPFGLSIVVHLDVGPFHLGARVVRARIAVNPEDSTLTVTTDESGPYAVPQIVFGVPVRLKRVTVNIDRLGFMFNPTNCNAQSITASISGSEEAVANVSSPFAVGACKSLAFKPTFKVSTSGKTSRANGASLDAKLSFPVFKAGSEANIARVKVDLPKQLPSRLTTLQKACTAAVFAANPGSCPSASIVGIARASTPLLPVGLAGPVYFVSHGGEAFPSLIVVLQGDGIRVDLTGATFISKAGITSSTFKTVPDVPVNMFELYLPEGRYSALAANGNLCSLSSTVTVKRKVTQRVHGRTEHRTLTTHVTKPANLSMPTEFVAQNGAVLKQSTKITATGCATGRAKSARRRAHGARKGTAGGGRGR